MYRQEYRSEPKEPTQFGSVSGLQIQNLPFSHSGIVSLYRSEPKEQTKFGSVSGSEILNISIGRNLVSLTLLCTFFVATPAACRRRRPRVLIQPAAPRVYWQPWLHPPSPAARPGGPGQYATTLDYLSRPLLPSLTRPPYFLPSFHPLGRRPLFYLCCIM